LSKTKLSETGVQYLHFYFLVFENWDDFVFITTLCTVSEADATGWEHASAATDERKQREIRKIQNFLIKSGMPIFKLIRDIFERSNGCFELFFRVFRDDRASDFITATSASSTATMSVTSWVLALARSPARH
jgi:hypothetical protein